MTKKRIHNVPPSQTKVEIKEAMMLHWTVQLKGKKIRNMLHSLMIEIKLMLWLKDQWQVNINRSFLVIATFVITLDIIPRIAKHMKMRITITSRKMKDSLNIKRHSLDIVIAAISLVTRLLIAELGKRSKFEKETRHKHIKW